MFETICKRQTMKKIWPEISTTNQFLLEIARTIREGDSEEQQARLEWIENEVSTWCCDDDEGAVQLIRAVRFMLEQQSLHLF